MGVDAPPSGWQFSILKYEFELVKDKKPTIIAVDEVDTLLYKEREPLIYYLNRQPYISLILISNQFSDLTNFPPPPEPKAASNPSHSFSTRTARRMPT